MEHTYPRKKEVTLRWEREPQNGLDSIELYNVVRCYYCNSGLLRHGSPPNLHNLAKWHLKRIVLISRHETWQTVLAQWP